MLERRLFNSDDKISPGLYMKYWESIVKKHGSGRLDTNLLKQYREVRNGAIIAALWTKTTGIKHFVSFPHEEPNDVEIYSLEPTEFKGVPSWKLSKSPIQLTRCSPIHGETVLGQILKKNKEYLKETILVVHILGEDGVTINLNKIVEEVRNIEIIYPPEIVLVAPIEDPGSPEQTYAQLLIYKRGQNDVRISKVDYGDPQGFFEDPQIMQSQMGTGRAIEVAGSFSLMLP